MSIIDAVYEELSQSSHRVVLIVLSMRDIEEFWQFTRLPFDQIDMKIRGVPIVRGTQHYQSYVLIDAYPQPIIKFLN